MNIGIRIISQPALWPEMADRLGRLQETLQVDLHLPEQPEPFLRGKAGILRLPAAEATAKELHQGKVNLLHRHTSCGNRTRVRVR